MMKTMLWKEWRESVRWLPIPIVVFSMLLWLAMPDRGAGSQGFGDEIASLVGIAASITAGLIGVLQTLPESRTDTRGLLFGRPISREKIYLSKTIVAAAIYWISLGIPLIYAAIWLDAVAPQTRPGEPIQLLTGVIVGIACFGFHPAVCWTISRPARWIGTRIFPLVIPLGLFAMGYATVTAATSWMVLWSCTAGIVAILILLYFSASHAFCQLTRRPPVSHRCSSFQPATVLLVVACLAIATAAGVAFVTNVPALQPNLYDMAQSQLMVDDQGNVYNTVVRREYNRDIHLYDTKILNASPADRLSDDSPAVDVPKPAAYADQQLKSPITLANIDWWHPPILNPYDQWGFTRFGKYGAVYHRDGYYLLYDRMTSQLSGYLTRSGIGSDGERFDGLAPGIAAARLMGRTNWTNANQAEHGLLVDRGGIYQLGDDGVSVRTLAEQSINSAALIPPTEQRPPIVWLHHGQEITSYQMKSTDPKQTLLSFPNKPGGFPQVELIRQRVLKLDQHPGGSLAIADFDSSGTVIIDTIKSGQSRFVRFDASGANTDSGQLAVYRQASDRLDANALVGSVFPPVMMMATTSADLIWQKAFGGFPMLMFSRRVQVVVLWLTLLHSAVAVTLTVLVCRRRFLSTRATLAWAASSIFLGIGTALAVISVYPKTARQPCHGCDALVRVDLGRCPACGIGWEPPARDGCEIFEGESESQPVVVQPM